MIQKEKDILEQYHEEIQYIMPMDWDTIMGYVVTMLQYRRGQYTQNGGDTYLSDGRGQGATWVYSVCIQTFHARGSTCFYLDIWIPYHHQMYIRKWKITR